MYFVPLLFGVLTLLLIPSKLLALTVVVLAYAILKLAGRAVDAAGQAQVAAQLSMRILAVKLTGLNGPLDQDSYTVHALELPDEPETAELRAALRNAAATAGSAWRDHARIVYRAYRKLPDVLLRRYDSIIIQLRAQPVLMTEQTEDRLVQLAKLWKIGPKNVAALLQKNNHTPTGPLAAFIG